MNRRIREHVAIIAALVTFVVYLPALWNEFAGVWDDNVYLLENPYIRRLNGSFFRWAFSQFYASNWHPLTWMSHALDYAVWGLNPLGHHLTSITIHAVNAGLVALLVSRLLDISQKRAAAGTAHFPGGISIPIAAGVSSLLFGLHPLHVESVAWASERKDLLCGLFFLLSLITYIEYAGRGQGAEGRGQRGGESITARFTTFSDGRYLASIVLFVCALLSKSMAVSLPFVLLILDWYPLRRLQNPGSAKRIVFEKIPYILLSLGASIISVSAQKAGNSPISADLASLPQRVMVAANAVTAYLGNMIAPLRLAPFYPYPDAAALASARYPLSLLFVVVATLVCVLSARKRPFGLAAWAYYLVTLAPVIGIVQVGNQAMADRYTYLPSVAIFLIAGIGVAWLFERARAMKRPVLMPLGFAAFALVLLSVLAVRQIAVWKNDYTLWDSTIHNGFASATAYNNRGLALDERGLWDRAAQDFDQAIAADADNYFAYNNRGVLFGKEGRFEQSIRSFQKAIALNATHPDSYCNLGLSYFSLKQYPQALENYNKAIQLKPGFDTAYLNRANLYFTIGKTRAALEDYRRACSLHNGRACEALHLLAPSVFAPEQGKKDG